MADDFDVIFTEETADYETVPDDELIAYAIQQYSNHVARDDKDDEPGLFVKAVVVAEFINGDRRYLEIWRIPDPGGCTTWEAKGLLTHALGQLEYDDDE